MQLLQKMGVILLPEFKGYVGIDIVEFADNRRKPAACDADIRTDLDITRIVFMESGYLFIQSVFAVTDIFDEGQYLFTLVGQYKTLRSPVKKHYTYFFFY